MWWMIPLFLKLNGVRLIRQTVVASSKWGHHGRWILVHGDLYTFEIDFFVLFPLILFIVMWEIHLSKLLISNKCFVVALYARNLLENFMFHRRKYFSLKSIFLLDQIYVCEYISNKVLILQSFLKNWVYVVISYNVFAPGANYTILFPFLP